MCAQSHSVDIYGHLAPVLAYCDISAGRARCFQLTLVQIDLHYIVKLVEKVGYGGSSWLCRLLRRSRVLIAYF